MLKGVPYSVLEGIYYDGTGRRQFLGRDAHCTLQALFDISSSTMLRSYLTAIGSFSGVDVEEIQLIQSSALYVQKTLTWVLYV